MEIARVRLLYFSPTGTTQRVLRTLAAPTGLPVEEHDFTLPGAGGAPLALGGNELAVLGIPVYSGRVPRLAAQRLAAARGAPSPAVLVATYGVRAYDDALLELQGLAAGQGLIAVAAAAFVTEHSIVREIGAGRPDAADLRAIGAFGAAALQKARDLPGLDGARLQVKGNPQFRTYQRLPIRPHATHGCTRCEACAAACPAGAIPMDDPRKTDKGLCISCMRCLRVCPRGARRLHGIEMWGAKRLLLKKCGGHPQPEIFI